MRLQPHGQPPAEALREPRNQLEQELTIAYFEVVLPHDREVALTRVAGDPNRQLAGVAGAAEKLVDERAMRGVEIAIDPADRAPAVPDVREPRCLGRECVPICPALEVLLHHVLRTALLGAR